MHAPSPKDSLTPSVAVVICCYTVDRWDALVASVASVQAQNRLAAEIIIVVDHEPELLARSRTAFEGCVVVPNRHQRGLSGARNTGLDACHSEIIAFLDDDARAAPDWLSVLQTAFDRERVVAAGGRASPVWASGRPSWMPATFDWVVGCSYEGLPTTAGPVRNVIGCNMAFRADRLRAAGGFTSRLGRTGTSVTGVEETEVCIRLRQMDPSAEIMYLPAARVAHSVPDSRATWRYFARRCLAEGRSKAVLTTMVGAADALASERRYMTRVLPRAAAGAAAAAIRSRRPQPLTQVAAMAAGLALTGAGYVWARFRGARTVELPGVTVKPPLRGRRVALVSARFIPMMGGTEMHIAEVAPRLAGLGYDIEVLTTDPSRTLSERAEYEGIRVRRFVAWPRDSDLHWAPGIVRGILGRRYDIVHLQGVHTLVAPLAMAAAIVARTPFLVTFHTGGHPSALRRRMRAVQWLILRPMLRRASALVAVSLFEQRLFARALGVSPEKIHVIPNGLSRTEDAVTVREDPDLIMSVGRLEWYKGHHRVIAALPHLLRDRPDARLLILGTGPERARLTALAESLGVSRQVTIDHVPPEERGRMRELLASARLVVLLSEYEAHPLAVTEALALGRRVLVADTSGLSEIAAAGAAWAIPLDASPDITASAMLRAMSEPAPADVGALATWDESAEAVQRLYASVLAR